MLPAAIRSHVLPSFYLSAKLQQGYDIYYLSSDLRYKELINAQGYGFIHLQSQTVGYYAEQDYVHQKYKKLPAWIKALLIMFVFLSNKIYRSRKKELKRLIGRFGPSLILIDSFNSIDFLFFYQYHQKLKIYFYTPILHADASVRPKMKRAIEKPGFFSTVQRHLFGLPTQNWNDWIDGWQVKRCVWLSRIPARHSLDTSHPFITYRFRNTVELVLGPRQLEYPELQTQSQSFYLGLCTQVQRRETGTDPLFDLSWLQALRKNKRKLVYCSFGTFYRSAEQHLAIINFINRLVMATMDRTDLELVVALNSKTAAIIRSTLPAFQHIHIFGVLPQLHLLSESDVFITHAGLGSVKEAIYFRVPMLACPVDFRWDQPANARRIEFHRLGIAGDLRNDSAETIEANLGELLENKEYRKRLISFSNSIREEMPEFLSRSCSA